MKRNKMLHRILSLTAAVALCAQTMVTMAFAAPGVITLTSTSGTVAATDGEDIFYLNGTSITADTGVIVTGFSSTQDWLACNEATQSVVEGNNLKVQNAAENILVTLTCDNAETAKSRIIATSKPHLRSAAVNKTALEQGEKATITATAIFGDGGNTGMTYAIAPAATSQNGGAFTIDTTGMEGKQTYTVTAIGNGTTTAGKTVEFTVAACAAVAGGVTVQAAGANKFGATVSYTPACTTTAHNDQGVTWSISDTTKAAIAQDGTVTPAAGLAPGAYTVDVTATSKKDPTKSGTVQHTVTIEGSCDGQLTGGTVSSNAGSAITLKQGESKTVSYAFAPTYAATTCNQHGSDPTHGLTTSVTWSLDNAPAGVTVDGATGAVTIGKDVPTVANIIVKATSTAARQRNTPAVATLALNVTREVSAACKVTGIAITPTGNTLTVGAGQTSTQVYTATLTVDGGTCAAHAANDPTHGKTLTWNVVEREKTAALAGVTIDASGKLSAVESTLVKPTTVVIVTAAVDGTAGSASLTINRAAAPVACTKKVTGIAITPTGNTLTVGAGQTTTQVYTATFTFDNGACTAHVANDPTHDKALTWKVVESGKTAAPTGVTIDAAGKLTVVENGSIAQPTTTVTVTAAAESHAGTATLNITRAVAPVACAKKVTGIAITPTGNTLTVGIGQTLTQAYTATLTFDGGACTTHAANDPTHGKTITWNAPENGTSTMPAGVTIAGNGAGATLTVAEPTVIKLTTGVSVTAMVDGVTGYAPTSIQRCNTVLQGATDAERKASIGSPTPGTPSSSNTLQKSSSSTKLIVNSTTATLPFTPGSNKPVLVGSCGHGTNVAACPYVDNHRPVWTLDNTYSGISIDPVSGVLTVTRKSLARVETTIGIRLTLGGKNNVPTTQTVGYIVVRNNNYSSDNTTSEDREAERNEEQWDKLEYRIEDAERKEKLTVNLASNNKFPSYIIDTLYGKDVTVEMTVDGGFTWIVNGKDLKKLPQSQLYIPLGVKSVSKSRISELAKEKDILAFELSHSGSFYGTYTLKKQVGDEYTGKYVYLYKYTTDASKLAYRGSAKVDSDGYVKFPFTSASTYVITEKALYGETAGSTVGSGTGTATGGTTGGTSTAKPPVASSQVPASSSSVTSSSSSSSESSSVSEVIEPSSSSQEISRPTDTEPEEPEPPVKKKSIPIIVPILIVVVVLTVVAVVLLAKGGMNIGG